MFQKVKSHRNFHADLRQKDGISADGTAALYMASRTSGDAGYQAKMLATSLIKAFECGLNDPIGRERSDLIFAVAATLESMAVDLGTVNEAIDLAEMELANEARN